MRGPGVTEEILLTVFVVSAKLYNVIQPAIKDGKSHRRKLNT